MTTKTIENAGTTAEVETTIHAAKSRVWHALTDPSAIREYYLGATVRTDWSVGGPITWSGEWNGKQSRGQGRDPGLRARTGAALQPLEPEERLDSQTGELPHRHDRARGCRQGHARYAHSVECLRSGHRCRSGAPRGLREELVDHAGWPETSRRAIEAMKTSSRVGRGRVAHQFAAGRRARHGERQKGIRVLLEPVGGRGFDDPRPDTGEGGISRD